MDLRRYRRPLLFIGIAFALPALTILMLQFSQLRRERSGIEMLANSQAKQLALLADMQIQSSLSALKILAVRHSLTSGEWVSAKKSIRDASALNPQWKNVFILDVQNKKIIVAREDTILPPLPADLENLKPGVPRVGGIAKEGTGCPCVYLYTAIPSESKVKKYVIGVALDPRNIQSILLKNLPPETVSAIVDRNGNFIARWPNYEKRVGEPASTYLRDAIKGGLSGFYRSITLEGFKSYTAFFTSPETGWSGHVAVASSLIDLPRLWTLILGALGMLLAMVVAGAMIFYIIRQFESETSGQLAAIVASSDDAIISKNLNGMITSWNASAEKIFGFSADEAIGKHISLIIPKDRLSEENEIISKIKSGQRVQHYETARRRKNGSSVNLSITVSPVKDKHGLIIGASKVARDISERKSTETQLLEERETLETLNRLAPALAATQDLETLVQLATDETTKLTGAAFGAFFYNVINEDGKAYLLYTLSGAPREAFQNFGMPRATEVFASTFKGEGTMLLDDVTKDPRYGKSGPYHGMPKGHLPVKSYLAVPVVSRTGEVIGGLFFGHPEAGVFQARDARVAEGIAALAAVGIDNARLYEQVKLGQKKAEDANRAKSDFLATMSHEIRTPMNAIVGLTSILGMSEPLTAKQKEYVRTLQTSGDSLLQLINDLLDISKIEARTVEFENVAFSLENLIEEVVAMMSARALEKNLKLSADTARIAGQTFMGDPTRLRQIMNNLCSNSIKFTEKGGVSIRMFSEKGVTDDIAKVSILVQDTGIGIPVEKLDTVFEIFVQADSSISRKYGGTGLGLSITKKLVDLMKGTISVASKVGEGTLFTVSLPLQRAAGYMLAESGPRAAPEWHAEHGAPAYTVLLVEDHEPNVMVAEVFLESLGYAYDVARNGAEAIEKATSRDFDAILMDVQMPGVNGFEATRAIRVHEQKTGGRRVPIIGVTAHALSGDRERCLAEGMDEYITKPFDMTELEKKLERLISVTSTGIQSRGRKSAKS